MGLTIRKPTRRELTANRRAVVALLNEIHASNFEPGCDSAAIGDQEYTRLLSCESEGTAVLVCAFAGTAIVAILWAYERSVVGMRRLHVTQLGVSEGYRSQGVGEALVHELERIAETRGISTIELMASLNNVRAMRFYGALGFNASRVLLEKHLAR